MKGKWIKTSGFALSIILTNVLCAHAYAATVATGYVYEITSTTGATFASVRAPSFYGDGIYDLSVWNGLSFDYATSFSSGEQYDFLTNYTDVYKFMIDGIEISAMLNPNDPSAFITGLTFTSAGSVSVNQTAVETYVPDSSAVPEASTFLLFLAGFLGLFKGKRRVNF